MSGRVFSVIAGLAGKGVLAGLIATLPMTAFMLLMQRLLPKVQQFALPPERITAEIAERAGVKVHMNKAEQVAASLVSHFSYGANMGTFYIPFAKRVPLPPALKGAIFGVIVWAASYLGLLPALRMQEQAPKEPLQRNALMIAAHLIWGTTLGVTEDLLERRQA